MPLYCHEVENHQSLGISGSRKGGSGVRHVLCQLPWRWLDTLALEPLFLSVFKEDFTQ